MTPEPREVHIIGLGAATPVGLTPLSAAGAVRAGISRQREHGRFIDGAGEPAMVAAVPYLPEDLELLDRLLELALDAVADALGPLREAGERERAPVPLFLGLPPPGGGRPEGLAREVVTRFPGQIGELPEISRVEPIAAGHAAGLMALERAWRAVRAGEHRLCLAAGVDSYLDPEVLRELDDDHRLLSEGRPFGFCPGEGAGAVLLAAGSPPGSLRSLGRVVSVATAREDHLIGTGEVCTGAGLTAAWREVIGAVPEGEEVSRIFCDLNGEPYRTDEVGFALVRLTHRLAEPGGFVSPAESWGDVGAASGPLQAVLAVAEGSRGLNRGRWALLSASSDGGERSAALLEIEGER